MEGKNKYSKTGFMGFMRYIGNNLSGREKNSFERELQKDRFAAEAEEGLSSIGGDTLKNDMQILSGRLKRRTSVSRRVIIYRIAATVAVLMTLTTVYMLLHKSDEIRPSVEPIALEIAKSEKKPAIKDEEKNKIEIVKPRQEDLKRRAEKRFLPSGQIAQNKVSENIRDSSRNEEKITLPEISTADIQYKTSPSAPPSRSIIVANASRVVRGRIISSDDKSPLPGATIVIKGTVNGTTSDSDGNFKITVPDKTDAPLVASYIGMESREIKISYDSLLNVTLNASTAALSEVVVTGYGSRSRTGNLGAATGAADKSLDKKDAISIDYTHPEPESGKKNFDLYIENNLRKPDILKEGDKAVVVLSFIVRISGIPDSIQVIRSQGDVFSREAIRLIKEGPKWKPATENGNPIEEEARVRIVFK